ncbi:hypothetical protein ACFYY8_03245 [Streptosporangium sp. NPDC001559]|uniref:hypothetical protein n=1 Tax=Streptosporangium sp. NPDC001559 TaxID=3366187 RepID=UPI0036EEB1EF
MTPEKAAVEDRSARQARTDLILGRVAAETGEADVARNAGRWIGRPPLVPAYEDTRSVDVVDLTPLSCGFACLKRKGDGQKQGDTYTFVRLRLPGRHRCIGRVYASDHRHR